VKPVSGPKKPCQDLPDFRHVVETIRKSYSDCRLIAIDGLPCSGKTTLAAALGQSLDVNFLHFDDFLLSPSSWPGDIRPLFPFPFFRHKMFFDAVRAIARDGICSFFPFDWDSMEISGHLHHVRSDRPILVEGVSVLSPEIPSLYDVRIFVQSDRSSLLEAVCKRDGNLFREEWETLFIPSADLYMRTRPEARSDFLVRGRGLAALSAGA